MKPETRDALAGRRTATGTFVQERIRAGHSVNESYPPNAEIPAAFEQWKARQSKR